MKESEVEAYLVRRVEAIGCMCEKFVSPNKRHVPDRLITRPFGEVVFVEVKAPDGELEPGQKRDHEKRRALEHDVTTVYSKAGVDTLVAQLQSDKLLPIFTEYR